jgi:PhnB protein
LGRDVLRIKSACRGQPIAWRVLGFGNAGRLGTSVLPPPYLHSGGTQTSKFRSSVCDLTNAAFGISPTREPIMSVRFIPDGYHTVTPYLTVRDATNVIEFLKQAFGAKLSHDAIKRPDGSIMHAQVTIGDSRVMIADENEMAKATVSTLYVYVPNVDSVYQQAIKAGGSNVMEPMDMFYGDRSGGVRDPSGNSWFIATHKEDVEPKELAKRAEAFNKQQKGKAA